MDTEARVDIGSPPRNVAFRTLRVTGLRNKNRQAVRFSGFCLMALHGTNTVGCHRKTAINEKRVDREPRAIAAAALRSPR